MDNLKVLQINEPVGNIDLSQCRNLEVLSIEGPNKNIINLHKCVQLKKLYLMKYKPTSKNLEELSPLKNLEELTLTQSGVSSLKGSVDFNKLRKIELNFLSKLEDISELKANAGTLEHLTLESCKNVNLQALEELSRLERLSIINCGEIQSLSFIKHLTKLKFLVFSKTNVIDGDLSYCKGIEYVGFDNKKHYSHKMSDFA